MTYKDYEEHKRRCREYYHKNKIKIKPKRKKYWGRYYQKNKLSIIERTTQHQKKNRKRYNQYSKNWSEKNHEKRIVSYKKYRDTHKEEIKRYREENRERTRAYHKIYRQKNKAKIKKYFEENKDKLDKYQKDYHKKPEVRKRKRDYLKNKKRVDLSYKISCALRTRFIEVLKKYTSTGKIMPSEKYGVDYEAIIEHLKPFPKNIENYEIHHIQPLFTFKFVNADGSPNLEAIKEAFKPENHKWVTKEEHYELHKERGNNRIKWKD